MSTEAITVSDSGSEDDAASSNIPSAQECDLRCQKFVEVTGTDTALAMFYLQDREWSLERAIGDYLSQNEDAGASTAGSIETSSASDKQADLRLKNCDSKPSYLTTAPPVLQPGKEHLIRVLSWNLDGLDPDNLRSRTEGACSTIILENVEIVFLQEVVTASLKIIESKCTEYHVFNGAGENIGMAGAYFTAMLLRKDVTEVGSVKVADFPTTTMSRNLLEVQCRVKKVPLVFLTSHLESMANFSTERKKQLKVAFDRMVSLPRDTTVVFGGDLNLRDKELTGQSKRPDGIEDLWECTGKRQEAKYTWDTQINDNKEFSHGFKPRCRFDRLYFRSSVPSTLRPVYFELVGIQRLQSCRRFPSDHWGILAHFNIL